MERKNLYTFCPLFAETEGPLLKVKDDVTFGVTTFFFGYFGYFT